MKQPAGWKRRVWFWVGVVLLSLSALLWLLTIIGMAVNPEAAGEFIVIGVFWSVIPIGIGIYWMRRGRKPRGAMEEMKGAESQQVIASHTIGWGRKPRSVMEEMKKFLKKHENILVPIVLGIFLIWIILSIIFLGPPTGSYPTFGP